MGIASMFKTCKIIWSHSHMHSLFVNRYTLWTNNKSRESILEQVMSERYSLFYVFKSRRPNGLWREG